MKTTSIGSKMARLHSGIGNAIMSLAMSRVLNMAIAEARHAPEAPRGRSRTPGPVRATGAKLRRAAHNGTLTVRHASATDQYWRDVYAKRLMAARDKRTENAAKRQAAHRAFAFQQ